MIEWLIFPIYLIANIVQGAAGFGSALVAMPLLIGVLGLSTARSMFSLTAIITASIILFRYREQFRLEYVKRILPGTLIGIPFGVVGAGYANERIVLAILGAFTIAYAVYALSGRKIPEIKKYPRLYPFAVGLIGGLLSGAYNTPGPPYVIYGDSQRWQPELFKSNLQALFMIGGGTTAFTHFITGHVEQHMLVKIIFVLPAIFIGAYVGTLVDRVIKPETFRKGVLLMLIALGLTLIF